MAIVGLVLVYLGAFNAALAMEAGTCTQGDATRLYGGIITLVLYMIGGLLLFCRPPRLWHVAALTAATLIALWHTVFAIRLAWGYLVNGASACDILEGGPYEMDGNEPTFVALWLGLSLAYWSGFSGSVLRLKSRPLRQ